MPGSPRSEERVKKNKRDAHFVLADGFGEGFSQLCPWIYIWATEHNAPMRSPDVRVWWNAKHEVENAQAQLQTALVLKEELAARLAAGRTDLLQSGQALWAAVGEAK